MKPAQKILIVTGIILMFIGTRMIMKAKESNSMGNNNVGIENGNLKACGQKPNCVSTAAAQDSQFYIAPIHGDNIEALWDNLNILLQDMGFKIEKQETNYLHCTAKSKLFGFVDDLEFLLRLDEGEIHMRSQSRVGYSDMGVNRKRLERIRKALQPKY